MNAIILILVIANLILGGTNLALLRRRNRPH